MFYQKNKFIAKLLQELKGQEYLLLKFTEVAPDEMHDYSDLDLLMSPELADKILVLVTMEQNVLRYSLSENSSMRQLFLFFKDDSFLQIDCLYKLVRKDIVYLDNAYLFQEIKTVGEVQTYSRFCLLEHVVFFNQLNFAGVPEKYLSWFEKLPGQEKKSLLNKFREKYNFNFLNLNYFEKYHSDFRKHLLDYLKKQPENNWLPRSKKAFNYFTDTLKEFRNRKGFLISFTGVDGAGKSTILEDTRFLLSHKFRRKTIVLRHRPSVLPILSAWRFGKKKAEQIAMSRLPRQGKNTSKLNSAFRFFYYFSDYLIGRIYVFCRYELRGFIVLYDRYYFDFIVDGKRTNLNLDQQLPKFLYRFVQKPGINFFLYAPPDVILKRKKELSAEAISSLTFNYKNLFQEFSDRYPQQYLSIKNLDRTETLGFIFQHLKKML